MKYVWNDVYIWELSVWETAKISWWNGSNLGDLGNIWEMA